MVTTPKQAIALLVHRDISQINSLVKILEKDFDLYIHIDKKANIDVGDIATRNVWKKFRIHWGGYDIVQATVFLYKEILATKIPYTHIILLSGDALPVKSNDYITNYLSANAGISFMENKVANELCLNRRRLIWYKEDFRKKVKGIKKLQNPFRIIRWIQKRLNIKRSTKGFERTGSQWTILALQHVQHLIDHCQFYKHRFMAVPDECFVQNHFTNHHFAYNTNMIYAHWPSKSSFSPHFIDENTYISLLDSPYLFARKFEAVSVSSAKHIVIKSNNEERVVVYNSLILNKFGQ